MILKTEFARTRRTYYHLPSGRVSSRLLDLVENLNLVLESLTWFLISEYVPGEATFFPDIICLPGGAEIEVQPGEITVLHKQTFSDLVSDEFLTWKEDDLINEGINRWRKAVARQLEEHNGDIVLPLSGGLDSRAILGELLQHRRAADIHTYTFGTPGSWDFDIGCLVAEAAGTAHTHYDLTQYEYSTDRLLKIADLFECSANIFPHSPYEWIERDFGRDSVVHWSGILGDELTGTYVPQQELLDLYGADYYVKFNRMAESVHLEDLLRDGPAGIKVDYTTVAPGQTLHENQITRQELYVFENDSQRYLTPILLPRGFTHAAPFTDKELVSFFLSLPNWSRQDQYLYKRILLKRYPALFSLPTKNTMGRPLRLPLKKRAGLGNQALSNPILQRIQNKFKALKNRHTPSKQRDDNFDHLMINYIDFSAGLRTRKDLISTVQDALQSLENRQILIKGAPEKIWQEHKRGTRDHGYAIMILCSLELYLQAAEKEIEREKKQEMKVDEPVS